jgi:hypothetical protein
MTGTVWFFFRGQTVRMLLERDGELQPMRLGSSVDVPLYFRVLPDRVEVGHTCQQLHRAGDAGIEARFLERVGDSTQLVQLGERLVPLAALFQSVLDHVRNATVNEGSRLRAVLVWGFGIEGKAREALANQMHGAAVWIVAQLEEHAVIAAGLAERGDADGPVLLLDAAYGTLHAIVLEPDAASQVEARMASALEGHGMGTYGGIAEALVSRAARARSLWLSPSRLAFEVFGVAELAATVLAEWQSGSTEWTGLVSLTGHADTRVRLHRNELTELTTSMVREREEFVATVLDGQLVTGVFIWSDLLWNDAFVRFLEGHVGAGLVHRPLNGGWPVRIAGAQRLAPVLASRGDASPPYLITRTRSLIG